MLSFSAFFQDVLRLPYKPNSQQNPLHENQVEDLLIKHGFQYEAQPNGIQNSPDFRVHLRNSSRSSKICEINSFC